MDIYTMLWVKIGLIKWILYIHSVLCRKLHIWSLGLKWEWYQEDCGGYISCIFNQFQSPRIRIIRWYSKTPQLCSPIKNITWGGTAVGLHRVEYSSINETLLTRFRKQIPHIVLTTRIGALSVVWHYTSAVVFQTLSWWTKKSSHVIATEVISLCARFQYSCERPYIWEFYLLLSWPVLQQVQVSAKINNIFE